MDGKKTLPLSWKKKINLNLRKLWKAESSAIVAIVGVGNELMGDDAAGMLVVRKLKASLPEGSLMRVIEGGPAPENCTGELRRLQPSLVIFVDAGNFGGHPGEIGFFSGDEAEGVSAFGHALPLNVLGKYIKEELGCESLLLLIQPKNIGFDHGISGVITQAIEVLSNGIIDMAVIKTK
jgi:hydrogenase 3 maturation protease